MGFYIKRGDTLPPLVVDLAYSDGSPLNLAGATGRFLMRRLYQTDLVIDADIPLDTDTGTATWNWADGGADIIGRYLAEIEIRFTDGSIQTFPTVGALLIHVVKDMGGIDDES